MKILFLLFTTCIATAAVNAGDICQCHCVLTTAATTQTPAAPRYQVVETPDVVHYSPAMGSHPSVTVAEQPRPAQVVDSREPAQRTWMMTPEERKQYFLELRLRNPEPRLY